jgi:hypothetical protein
MELCPWDHDKVVGTSIVGSLSAGEMQLSCLPHLTGILPPENMLKLSRRYHFEDREM